MIKKLCGEQKLVMVVASNSNKQIIKSTHIQSYSYAFCGIATPSVYNFHRQIDELSLGRAAFERLSEAACGYDDSVG